MVFKPTTNWGGGHPVKSLAILSFWYSYLHTRRGPLGQWPFQEPKLDVPTIYKAYIRPI